MPEESSSGRCSLLLHGRRSLLVTEGVEVLEHTFFELHARRLVCVQRFGRLLHSRFVGGPLLRSLVNVRISFMLCGRGCPSICRRHLLGNILGVKLRLCSNNCSLSFINSS